LAAAYLRVDVMNPPAAIQARIIKEIGNPSLIGCQMVGFVPPGSYYKVEESAATVTKFRWIEVTW
jgi:hypothetical protein